ncbi:unnamed protein product [Amoebophrya sp. A120]|nr:unnamed protein product [Amoebophrya sp. A120]|eukprot:GSA120T00015306001.1
MATTFDHLFGAERACTVKDVKAQKFITALAKHMKRQGKFELPPWADVVKTGVSRELPPMDQDWLYIRAASIARHVYNRGGSGVGAFRKVYGGQQRRGTCTSHFRKSSGKIIRYCMQQLEEIGIIEIDEKTGGRRITPEGQREMDTVAVQALDEEDEDEDDE